MRTYRLLALLLLTCCNARAVPGNLNSAQAARLRKSRLVVLLPNYLPQGFVLAELECNSLEYRLVYRGPAKASFWICGRGAGVCDGGPGEFHYAVSKGPLKGSVVEFNKHPGRTGFYTGFIRLDPHGGESTPSFDVEGENVPPAQAVKIVESLHRLPR